MWQCFATHAASQRRFSQRRIETSPHTHVMCVLPTDVAVHMGLRRLALPAVSASARQRLATNHYCRLYCNMDGLTRCQPPPARRDEPPPPANEDHARARLRCAPPPAPPPRRAPAVRLIVPATPCHLPYLVYAALLRAPALKRRSCRAARRRHAHHEREASREITRGASLHQRGVGGVSLPVI